MLLELYIIAAILTISGKLNNYNIKNHPLDIRVKRDAIETHDSFNLKNTEERNTIEEANRITDRIVEDSQEAAVSQVKLTNISNDEEKLHVQVKNEKDKEFEKIKRNKNYLQFLKSTLSDKTVQLFIKTQKNGININKQDIGSKSNTKPDNELNVRIGNDEISINRKVKNQGDSIINNSINGINETRTNEESIGKEILKKNDSKNILEENIIFKSMFFRPTKISPQSRQKRNVTSQRLSNYYLNRNIPNRNSSYQNNFAFYYKNNRTIPTENQYQNINNFGANKITYNRLPSYNNGYNQQYNRFYQPANNANYNQNAIRNYNGYPLNNYKDPYNSNNQIASQLNYNNQFYYPYKPNNANFKNNSTNDNQNEYNGKNVNIYENNLLNSGITSTQNVPETTSSTSAPVILESCFLCASVGCPSFFKRIGFLCVDPNKAN